MQEKARRNGSGGLCYGLVTAAVAAAVVVTAAVVAAPVHVAAPAAVAEQQDQDDDPPDVAAAKASIVTAHKSTSDVFSGFSELSGSFHVIPRAGKCAAHGHKGRKSPRKPGKPESGAGFYRVRRASIRAVLEAVLSSFALITRAGHPATTVLGSTSEITTAPAATTAS